MKRTLCALFELLRLPNLFTVPGDILLGWSVMGGVGIPWRSVVASLCLYSAGLLFNDFFDAKVDAAERPSRPIPSGRISRKTVGILATSLMSAGLLLAWEAWFIALPLALLIFAYDAGLKKIPFVGILTMGCCRGGNILLGGAQMPTLTLGGIALFFTLYIVIVSLVARNEALPQLRHLNLPALVSKLIRFLIPLQFLVCFYTTPSAYAPVIIGCFVFLWLGAEISGRRFSGS